MANKSISIPFEYFGLRFFFPPEHILRVFEIVSSNRRVKTMNTRVIVDRGRGI